MLETIQVKNLKSTNGNPVPNQFIIWTRNKDGYNDITFQSYDTQIFTIEYKTKGVDMYIDINAFNYSKTTSKYLKITLINELGFTLADVEELKRLLGSNSEGVTRDGYINGVFVMIVK